MAETLDTWKKIDKRLTQLDDLYKRMDDTKDVAYLKKYQLTDFQNPPQPIPNVINVTGNKPGVFGHNIIADLINIKWQTVIEGQLSGNDAHLIEEFIEDNLQMADEYILKRYGIIGLKEWLCNHVCIRGPIGVMWMPVINDDAYSVHCLPLDMRYSPFLYGADGLAWIAPITYRTKEELESELENYDKKDIVAGFTVPDGDDIEVRDYWDGKKNELWIATEKAVEREHPFGKPPGVIAFPPAGFMLRDKGYLKHEGEDIFYLIRDLNEELNRQLTIEQSLIYNALHPPYEREVETPDAGPSLPAPKAGESLDVAKGEMHKAVPTGDFNRANFSAKADLIKMFDEGAPVAPRMYTQPPSGAMLVAEMEALQRLQGSRIVTLKVLFEGLYRDMIEFWRTISADDGEAKIGKIGKKRHYTIAQLKDPKDYSIECHEMTKSKRQELANMALFLSAYGKLPMKYNLTNVLQAEDPEGIMRELAIEEIERADPSLALLQMAFKLIDEAEELEDEAEYNAKKLEARMLIKRGVGIIKTLQNGGQPAPEVAEGAGLEQRKGNPNILPALIGASGMPAGTPKEAQPPNLPGEAI